MLRIATRRSALARAQACQAGQLIAARTGEDFELVPMATTGDLHPDRPITAFETKGLFVDKLREAVLSGECDLVVHSYKDLPTVPAPGLVIGAVPPREDPRDALVTRAGHALASMPERATVGTSSQRRRLQLLFTCPSLQVPPLRGNLDTRLRKVAEGELDAVVVALAGLRRLYGAGPLDLPVAAAPLEPGECLPSPGQGALAVECRADDEAVLAICGAVDDEATRWTVRAERAYLEALGGGCLAPVGALARMCAPDQLELVGMLACPVTGKVLRRSLRGPGGDPQSLGAALAEDVRAAGGQPMLELIEELRARQALPAQGFGESPPEGFGESPPAQAPKPAEH
ncbi:MAG: hydroxymethylbilane synthase [Egibacteraceae bacterium]